MFYQKKIIIIILLFIFSSMAMASWNRGVSVYKKRMNTGEKARVLVIELVSERKYYSALPWMKEYLASGTKKLDRKMEKALTRIISSIGVKQFEVLPVKYLSRSSSSTLRYIIAKKFLRKNHYSKALRSLSGIRPKDEIYPFAKNLEGTIYAIKGRTESSVNSFKICEEESAERIKRNKSSKKLILNRDYCTVGIARANFAAKKFDDSDLLYLDIPKSSMIWPEILFEEAWNSYYQKNYNRTLGKLVSYKAPVFDYVFNPEIDVLSALTYLKMCLYNDAKKISTNFYKEYMKPTRRLRLFLKSKRKKTDIFFDMMLRFEKSKRSNSKLMTKLLKSISRDAVYQELKKGLSFAANEYSVVREKSSSSFKRRVVLNIKESIRTQRKIIGAYISSRLVSHYASLYKAFEGMSYINLEILAQRKARLYNFDDKVRGRGDIKFIEQNEKQYFWNFNGEFWADELGDYVFALKSEC